MAPKTKTPESVGKQLEKDIDSLFDGETHDEDDDDGEEEDDEEGS